MADLSPLAGGTIVARNYLAHARVLTEGWRQHHGDLPFRVLVLDANADWRDEGIDVLHPSELDLDEAELARLRGLYGVAELTSALKPHLLRALLDLGAEAAVFIDSDTDLHAPLHDVGRRAARHGIALTTHFLRPPPLDSHSPSEPEIQWTGIFNSGFIAVGRSGGPFLDGWASRLARDCLFSEINGMHADQRWLNLAPSYFPHHILRDPGVNVAQWNLHERPIRIEDGRFTAGGEPLRAFHFSGFSVEQSDLPGADVWPSPLRFDIGSQPALRRLCRGYAGKLVAAGHEECRRLPYRDATSASGRTLGRWERWAYRELVIAAESRGVPGPPHPFDPSRAPEFDAAIADVRSTGLLSAAAAARVEDARLAEGEPAPGALAPLHRLVGLSRQALRRTPLTRHPWNPHPLGSERIRSEYPSRRSSEGGRGATDAT